MTPSFANLKRLLLRHEDRIVADAEAILAAHGIPELLDEHDQPLGTVQQALRGPRSIHHFAMPLLDALTAVTGDGEAAIAAQLALQKQWHTDVPPAAGLLSPGVGEQGQRTLLSGMLARHAAQARTVHLFSRFPRTDDAFAYAINILAKMERSDSYRNNRLVLEDAIDDSLDILGGLADRVPRQLGKTFRRVAVLDPETGEQAVDPQTGEPKTQRVRTSPGWDLDRIARLTAASDSVPSTTLAGPNRRWKTWRELAGLVARAARPVPPLADLYDQPPEPSEEEGKPLNPDTELSGQQKPSSPAERNTTDGPTHPAFNTEARNDEDESPSQPVPGTRPWIVEPDARGLTSNIGLAVARIQGFTVALQHQLAPGADFATERNDQLTLLVGDLLPLSYGDLLTGDSPTANMYRWAFANIAIGAVAGRPPATVAQWLNEQLGTSAWSERSVVTRHINRIAQQSCPHINPDRWRRHIKVDNHIVDWRRLLLPGDNGELFTVPRIHDRILDTYIQVLAGSLLADDDPGWRDAVDGFRRSRAEMDLVTVAELPPYAVRQIAAMILVPTDQDRATVRRIEHARTRTDMLGVRFHRLLHKQSEHDHACPCQKDASPFDALAS